MYLSTHRLICHALFEFLNEVYHCVCSQLEVLIKEVQVLREELRSRDKTIAQLTLQCQELQQQHQREQIVSCKHDRYN